MPRRFTAFLAAAALQVVALVLAHELVYLARYGSLYGEALVHAGHGEAWSAAVTASLLVSAGLASVAAFRLMRLGLLVRRRDLTRPASVGALESRPLLHSYLRIAPRLVLVGVALLSIQENVEHAVIGQAVPGPGILLTPEYAGGLWITIAVGLVVAFVAALFDWQRQVLLAKLRTARPRPPRPAAVRPPRPAAVERPVESLLGRRSALRAPPLAVAS